MVKKIFSILLIIFLPLFFYLKTLAPGPSFLNYGDPSELQAASCTLGIAHPPGYPTYVILGKLFTFLPINKPGWRVNSMSAFFSICSLVLFFVICQALYAEKTKKHLGGEIFKHLPGEIGQLTALLATLILAFSQNFWLHSLFAEMYSLNVFFTLLFLWFILFGWKRGLNYYYLFFLLLGISQGNHRNITLITPLLVIYLFFQKPKAFFNLKKSCLMIVLFLLGLGVYLFLPIRSLQHAYLNYNRPSTWQNFKYLITSEQFRFLMFTVPTDKLLHERPIMLVKLLNQQFFIPGLVLAILGISWFLSKKRFRELALLMLIFLATAFVWLNYNTDDIHRYLTPSFVIIAFFIGGGIKLIIDLAFANNRGGLVRRSFSVGGGYLFTVCCLLFTVCLIKVNYPKVDLSQDLSAYNWGISYMTKLKPNAVVISYWAYSATMWYLQGCEKIRPDILVADDRVILDEGWITPLNTVKHFLGKRPIYIIPLYDRVEVIKNAGYQVIQQNGVYEVIK